MIALRNQQEPRDRGGAPRCCRAAAADYREPARSSSRGHNLGRGAARCARLGHFLNSQIGKNVCQDHANLPELHFYRLSSRAVDALKHQLRGFVIVQKSFGEIRNV